jgi:hypothetical protein
MLETHHFREIVLPYKPEAREAWTAGDTRLIPPGHPVPRDIANQRKNHFPEFYVLDHYRRTEGWSGYRWYVLCVVRDHGTEKYGPGGVALERVIPPVKLAALRRARSSDELERDNGKGEPDLFLYRDNGEFMFIETKMGDAVDPAQLKCLAQIRSILECAAEIVRIVPEGEKVRERVYSIEIDVPVSPTARAPIRRPRRG